MGVCQQEEEQCRGAGTGSTKCNYLRRGVEGGDQHRRQNEDDDTDQFCQNCRADNAKACTLSGSFILLCTEVLTDKGGHCHGEAGDRQKTETFDLGKGAAACHCHRAKRVDICLHNNVGQCDDRVLNAGRQTKADNLSQHIHIKADIPQRQTILSLGTNQLEHAQKGADQLGNGGRQCRSFDTGMKNSDEHQVEHHIDHRRNDQIVQRMAAVTYCLQNTYKDIVHDKAQRTHKVDLKISHRVGHNIFRCAHPDQNLRRKDDTDKGHDYACYQTKGNRRMNSGVQALLIPRTKIAGDNNACTDRNTIEETDQQKDQVT